MLIYCLSLFEEKDAFENDQNIDLKQFFFFFK